jgi:lysozyme
MRTSDRGLGSIKAREGVRLVMYRDSAGLPTIGVGHLLTKDELRSGKIEGLGHWTEGITASEADRLLRRDLHIAETAVEQAVLVPLSPAQFDTLVSFTFNVGTTAFRNSTLLRLLNAEQYNQVPLQLRRWIYSAGRVDPILVKRREDEARQWLAGTA